MLVDAAADVVVTTIRCNLNTSCLSPVFVLLCSCTIVVSIDKVNCVCLFGASPNWCDTVTVSGILLFLLLPFLLYLRHCTNRVVDSGRLHRGS